MEIKHKSYSQADVRKFFMYYLMAVVGIPVFLMMIAGFNHFKPSWYENAIMALNMVLIISLIFYREKFTPLDNIEMKSFEQMISVNQQLKSSFDAAVDEGKVIRTRDLQFAKKYLAQSNE